MNCMNCMRNTHTGRGGEEGRREGWRREGRREEGGMDREKERARARAREREREREREAGDREKRLCQCPSCEK